MKIAEKKFKTEIKKVFKAALKECPELVDEDAEKKIFAHMENLEKELNVKVGLSELYADILKTHGIKII